jgi:hypothetical protein
MEFGMVSPQNIYPFTASYSEMDKVRLAKKLQTPIDFVFVG